MSLLPISHVKAQELPYILRSGIEIKDDHPRETTYYFSLQVAGKALSQVVIDLPQGIKIEQRVDVVDTNNHEVGASYQRKSQQVLIAFAQPIAIGTTLNFYIHGLKTESSSPSVYNLLISVQFEGSKENIHIGTVRIQT